MNGVSKIPFSGSAGDHAARFSSLPCFVAGPENRLAVVVSDAILAGRLDFNPLVITGPPSSGKSHLAHGLARNRVAPVSADRLVHATGAEFAQQFARAIHTDQVPQLRKTYRTSKFIVLDGLEGLSGKVTAQQELLHTLDALLDHGAQVIATCREPLARTRSLLTALRSRLMAGLELPLVLPEAAARAEIVEQLALPRGTEITKTAARALADSAGHTAFELLGALTALEMAHTAPTGPIGIAEVEAYLLRRMPRPLIGLRDICTLSAQHFGLSVADLKSPSRERTVVLARGVAMYLARQATDKTLQQIGRFFGGRDHSTVLHGCRQIGRMVHSDAETRQAVEDLSLRLGTGKSKE